MLFPTISDYKNALVIPESFATLGSLRPEKGLFDDVYFSSGNFAVVFKMRNTQTGKLHAVKCFTREQDRRVESLKSISDYLAAVKSPYLVFSYNVPDLIKPNILTNLKNKHTKEAKILLKSRNNYPYPQFFPRPTTGINSLA